MLTTLSASAVLGEQTYGPYGNQRYIQGSMGTDKGYTGQFTDAVTGLDYYNARYYDPVIGAFLSPDNVQGNAQGMSPYLYVGGNPETATDPTGQRISCPPDCGGGSGGQAPCTYGDKGCTGDCNDKCGGGGSTYCPSGTHKSGSSCVNDGGGSTVSCKPGFSAHGNSCLGNAGWKLCAGLTYTQCDKAQAKQQKQRIQHAQADAQGEALKLFAISLAMGALITAVLEMISYLNFSLAATVAEATASAVTGIGAAIFGILAIAIQGLIIFLEGSLVTLGSGAVAASLMGSWFEGRAQDDNAADWTPAGMNQFDSQVNTAVRYVNDASIVVAVLSGNGLLEQIVSIVEPSTEILADYPGISNALSQMSADMNS